MSLMLTGQLTGALTAETSGSVGIIIVAIAGVGISLVLALIFVRRKNVTLQAPKGSQAAEPDEKGAAASTVTAEWAVEMATSEPKFAAATEAEHSKLEDASGGATSARTSSTAGHVPCLETELRPSTCKLPPTSQADKDVGICDIALTI